MREQLAGDAFSPGSGDGIVALGFLSAGPWDFVGHVEVRPDTMEKKRVRNLDRDGMVAMTMNAFVSLTVQCARCHDHKFDPISQEDYYGLQAVFAAVDRADRPYDDDPDVSRQRDELVQRRQRLLARAAELEQQIADQAGPKLAAIDRRLQELRQSASGEKRPEFGYHSGIKPVQETEKWVQVDLGRRHPVSRILFVGCHDDFAGIGAGFGFPVRYKVEISDDADFAEEVTVVLDRTDRDFPNPGVEPQVITFDEQTARYVRFTATKLAERRDDFIFALAELQVFTEDGTNAADGAAVTALDSIEAPPRWQKANLVDGHYYGMVADDLQNELTRLEEQRRRSLEAVSPSLLRERDEVDTKLDDVQSAVQALPAPKPVYAAATDFSPQGNFTPTHGRPRTIRLLARGGVESPQREVSPGTVGCLAELPSRFDLDPDHEEGQRRAALADWIVAPENPLTWRSIANRVWHFHFGRGIVETPNDFGRMGAEPTHRELLDWLAVEFRDHGQSFKDLHRLIVTSAVYRQASSNHPSHAETDGGNRFLWRMNRKRLEAEAIRDSVLAVSGKLNDQMGGPGFQAFGFQDDHSPRYLYEQHDPDAPGSHRRAVYRFIVRSVPDPYMEALDCANPSLSVPDRNETLTPLHALALMNDPFMVRMAAHFARRVEQAEIDLSDQIDAACRLAFGRSATELELETLLPVAREHGMANVCRLILNSNEFIYID